MKARSDIRWTFVLVLVAVMISSQGIIDARSMTLKVSHQFAVGDVRDQMARVFGEKVTERTNGEIKFRYYPAKSLYKPKEQWDALRHGALDMSVFPLDYASGKVPQLSITLMPCAVTSVEQGMTWRNKPIGHKVAQLMEDNGVKNLVWARSMACLRPKNCLERLCVNGERRSGISRSGAGGDEIGPYRRPGETTVSG